MPVHKPKKSVKKIPVKKLGSGSLSKTAKAIQARKKRLANI